MSPRTVPTRNAAWPIVIVTPILVIAAIVSVWRPPFDAWSAVAFLAASGALLAALAPMASSGDQLGDFFFSATLAFSAFSASS
jgi:hypothetical protein